MICLKGEAFKPCLEVLEVLTNAGYDAFLVGGAVRNKLLGLPVSDFDLATSAKPAEVVQLFDKVIPTGLEHGTVTVMYLGEAFEVTTFREDKKYTDFRHPSGVSYLGSIEGDLARRDFTINSMALSKEGDLIDLHGGQKDLSCKLIRTVGNPADRFKEDALRMLRAIRFLSKLVFSLDTKTEEALTENAHLLKHVAIERLQTEFSKLMEGKAVNLALKQLVFCRVHHYLPGLSQMASTLTKDVDLSLLETDSERWAWLSSHADQPVSFLKEWRLSNNSIKQAEHLITVSLEVQREGWNNRTVYDALPDAKACERLLAVMEQRNPNLTEIDRITSKLPITSRAMLVVTGDDLISWEQSKPGPWVGEALRGIELAVITEKIKNEKSSIRRWLKQWRTQ
ncbi:CCA tRNA nucleotidyltransferase [Guptibacillus hwajinpoensis]|uniref:tRNA nucleotidyltransferase (CCA-adding enzyme) n=1 Tax=Guptibacillus hwajinpoensis TaxID=208199 RepID=A0ABU0JY81_9BACL|nr:CCA tRNA nucleotidyltransferase [Alkalihalobacillus hemicentroti]MDQ0482008.1 tRNA nucleotidyltransferase (CCA-adding enzyme) [Alkalihalobacillus hemicentroti]